MSSLAFIPIMLATLALAFASFAGKKDWAVIAFVIWLVIFFLTFFV